MYGLNVNFTTSFLDKMLKIRCDKKVGGANARLPPPLYTPLICLGTSGPTILKLTKEKSGTASKEIIEGYDNDNSLILTTLNISCIYPSIHEY